MTFKTHFFGNEISEYGRKNGFVDYRTLAKSFDAVMSNDIISKTWEVGYWEQEHGFIDNYDRISELEDEISELEQDLATCAEEEEETIEASISEISEEIEELQNEMDYQAEIFQYFIIDENGAEILKEYTNEIVYYNEELNLYVWGVTHWGTSWDYVLTDIPCEKLTEA